MISAKRGVCVLLAALAAAGSTLTAFAAPPPMRAPRISTPSKNLRKIPPLPSVPALPLASRRIGAFTVTAPALYFNFATGKMTVPGVLSGYSADGDFRADRAFGNQRAGDLTLVGHVLVHKLGGLGKIGSPAEPVTLMCDQLQLQTKLKTYTASGNVRLMQGGKSLTAPFMRLNDNTHDAELDGGVHAEQPPDRSFDAPQVFYNTRTQDFKALGGVRATLPLARPTP